MQSHPRTALIVDDEVLVAALVEEVLGEHGFDVTVVNARSDLNAVLDGASWDLIVSDTDFASPENMLRWPTERLVVCSGKPIADLERAFPGVRLVPKPFSDDELLAAATG